MATVKSVVSAVKVMEKLLENKMKSSELINQINTELQIKSESVIAGFEEYKQLAHEHVRLLGVYRENALIVLAALKSINNDQEKITIKVEEMMKINSGGA